MTVDLHFICRHGKNHQHLGNQIHDSGNWTVANDVADEAIGGRIYLHEHQRDPAWHGGTILAWRFAPDGSLKKIFTYKVDGDFRFPCTGDWGQEKAIVRR